eukprot:3279042-Amphidinium_carterae.1
MSSDGYRRLVEDSVGFRGPVIRPPWRPTLVADGLDAEQAVDAVRTSVWPRSGLPSIASRTR